MMMLKYSQKPQSYAYYGNGNKFCKEHTCKIYGNINVKISQRTSCQVP